MLPPTISFLFSWQKTLFYLLKFSNPVLESFDEHCSSFQWSSAFASIWIRGWRWWVKLMGSPRRHCLYDPFNLVRMGHWTGFVYRNLVLAAGTFWFYVCLCLVIYFALSSTCLEISDFVLSFQTLVLRSLPFFVVIELALGTLEWLVFESFSQRVNRDTYQTKKCKVDWD